eukprot:COSAG02_NODE_18207_length_953_cov_1.612412_1_plen_183_part_01
MYMHRRSAEQGGRALVYRVCLLEDAKLRHRLSNKNIRFQPFLSQPFRSRFFHSRFAAVSFSAVFSRLLDRINVPLSKTNERGIPELNVRYALRRRWRSLRENGTFFEFSLCLSRACLGKMLIFVYKWLKKCRFLTSMVWFEQLQPRPELVAVHPLIIRLARADTVHLQLMPRRLQHTKRKKKF